ncbi:MAG: archaeal proteasome endopeptidase complex subunit alpha, partial [Nitrososphaeraceae archaeon]
MTLILGSRCSDGVVLVADKIVTNQADGLNFYFAEKLFSVLHNVVIGSSGS